MRDIVLRRAPWIIKHMGDDQPVVLTKQFVSGETLPYMGRNVTLS